jgi:hypothetical protein
VDANRVEILGHIEENSAFKSLLANISDHFFNEAGEL